MPFPVTYHSWQTVNLTLCQHPPIKENFGVLLRTCVRSRWLSLYARTQRKTENAPYRGIKSGSCPPAIGGEVGLHKGFDAHKAPDTPPGRIDDVVSGFQIIPALVGDQGIAEPSGLDRIQLSKSLP